MAWIAVAVVGGAAVGGTAMALSSKGGGEPNYQSTSYQESTREALQAQIDLREDLYKAEANSNYGRPAYARLMQGLAQESILGQEYEYDSQGRAVTGYEDLSKSYTIDKVDDLYGTREKSAGWGRGMVQNMERFNALKKAGLDQNSNYVVRDLDGNLLGGAGNEEEAQKIFNQQKKKAIYAKDADGNIIQDYSKRNTSERQGGGLASILAGDEQSEFYDGRKSRAGFDEEGNFLGTSQLEQDILEKAKRQQVQGEVGMAQEFGQELTNAYRAQGDIQGALDDFKKLGQKNADHAGLRSMMTEMAKEELALGGQLSDRERRSAQQASRAAMSARGLGRSFAGVVDEVEKNELLSRQRMNERRQFASYAISSADQGMSLDRAYAAQRVGLEQATSADPFMAITGRTSGAGVASGQNIYGNTAAGMSASPTLYNPHTGAEFIANQNAGLNNFNANMYAANAQKNAAMFGSVMSLGGTLGSAAIKACWVAREVYGVSNPKWMIFRHWMLFLSPFWFRSIYLNFGERFAKFIKNKPRLKARIRAWMDSKIRETI